MANPDIPVPTDLSFQRTAEDKITVFFTSTRDDLEYNVRLNRTTYWWAGADEGVSVLVPPFKAGVVGAIPFDLQGVVPSVPSYLFLTAKDPALLEPNQYSHIYPPPPDTEVTADMNYGQGPGVEVDWPTPWVPDPEPPPVEPPPVEPPPVEPPPVEPPPATGFPTTTVAEFPANRDEFYLGMPGGGRMKFGRLFKWMSLGWFGVVGIYLGKTED